MNTISGRLILLAVAFCGANVAGAASVSVSCPGTPVTTDREFTLTTDPGTAVCLASGVGNLNGNGDAINQLGYVLLDKSDDLTSGALLQSLVATPPTSGLGGTFSFSAPGYTDFVIALKSGNGILDPDWAAFSLPTGVTSGSWAISGSQQLSHVNLYGKVSAVPAPAAFWLFVSGVGGLVGMARRKAVAA